jgi:HlyD family type I secretion membrane fusion protein
VNSDTYLWSTRIPTAIGYSAIILVLMSFGAWSVGTQISGAVVASGTVELQSDRQVIQHPDGGVVGEVLVSDGSSVQEGEVLIRLDDTFLVTELAIVENQIADRFVRVARLQAEQFDAPEPDFSNPPEFRVVSPSAVGSLIEGQRSLFQARLASHGQEIQLLLEQEEQVEIQIEGLGAQLEALHSQRTLLAQELANLTILFDRGLALGSRLSDVARQDAELRGEIGILSARIAEARGRISELGVARLGLINQRREYAVTELREIGIESFELHERQTALRERLSRLEVRAPAAGIVFDSQVTTRHSVLRAAEPILYIVPEGQPLQISAKISPRDIDQVYPGQQVVLTFSAFSRQSMPEVSGTVVRVSPDAATDEVTRESYYQVVIQPESEELEDHPTLELLPGMPVEAFLQTTDRTPLSYLTQPLTIYFVRAFRSE